MGTLISTRLSFPGGAVPDDLTSRQSDDQEMINIHQIYDLRDWAIYFSVSKERIKEAVGVVGPRVEDVKRYLGK